MLRYRVMLTGPRRESRGKVRASPGDCLPEPASLTPSEPHCAALACVLPVRFALLPASPATHQDFHFNLLPLLLYSLHVFTSFALGSMLSVIMNVTALPLG